jgi:RNA polymerase sigma-70 factor (ECF subfamily)
VLKYIDGSNHFCNYLFSSQPVRMYGPVGERIRRLSDVFESSNLIERIDSVKHGANGLRIGLLPLVLNSGKQSLRPSLKTDDPALTGHKNLVFRPHHGSAPGCDNERDAAGCGAQGFCLAQTKPWFMSESQEVTMLLSALTNGDDGAASKLIPVVYDELRRLAGSYMRRERVDHTLQATALVHEAYLKLIEQRAVNWQSRAHFFGVAAQLMRRILIDHARGHTREKRGGEQKKVSLDEVFLFSEQQADELLAVDDSLNLLAKIDPRQARVVELRFFGGLSVEEAAEVLGVSPKTVKRDWSVAKAWLYADLKERYGIDAAAMGERQSAV